MELRKIISERKSIRVYEKRDVKSWIVGEILDAGRLAPSAGNVQNWRFMVVRDKDIKNKIASASLKQYWMNTAPVFIVICSDNTKVKSLYKKRGESLYGIQNCAVAATYMMLKAVDLGLGTCWVGAFNEGKVSDILRLDKSFVPQIILTLGYPEKSELNKQQKRHDLDKLVFFEKYKNKISKPPKRLADYVKEGFSKLKKK